MNDELNDFGPMFEKALCDPFAPYPWKEFSLPVTMPLETPEQLHIAQLQAKARLRERMRMIEALRSDLFVDQRLDRFEHDA